MKIRSKTIHIVFSVFLTLFAILYIAFETILMNGFKHLEKEETERNVRRVIEAINEAVSNISIKAADWAKWDDTYQFIKDSNQTYISSNLGDETFSDLKINFMLFVNNKGELIFGKEYNDQTNNTNEISSELFTLFKKHTKLFTFESDSDLKSGMILLAENPIFVTSRPILTSEGNGPRNGTLIVGKFIDKNEIDKLSHITHVSVELSLINNSFEPDLVSAQKNISNFTPVFINPIDKNKIAGYALLKDINGENQLIIRVDSPRDIYRQGLITKMYMLITILLLGLTFGIILSGSLEKIVISRLTRLNKDVSSISDSGDHSFRVGYSGNDELTSLSTSINNMLQALQRSEIKLLNTNHQMRLIMDTLPSGLLSIDENFNINPGYSKSVESILDQKYLTGKSFLDVLYPSINKKIERDKLYEFLDVLRQDIFPEKELAALNPSPILLTESSDNQRWVKLCYHKINRGSGLKNHILVDLEDITAEKQLEKMIKQSEQENLQLKIIAEDPDLFRYLLSDMKQVIGHTQNNLKILNNSTNKQKETIQDIYRDIHTIKGTSSSFGLSAISESAGELETCFHSILENKNYNSVEIANTIEAVDQLSKAIQKEIENTGRIIGEEIPDNGEFFLKLSINRFNQLYTELDNIIHKEITDPRKLLQLTARMKTEFLKLRSVPVKKGFAKALKTVPQLQKRFTNNTKFILEGDDQLIDCVLAYELNTPLIHLIRNAFAHGIEPPEERFLLGKTDESHVAVKVESTENLIRISVTDDGRGLNPEKIKQIATEKGFISESQAVNLSKKQILELILISGFTTIEKADEICGRGIGMDAVYNSVVNQLGGSFEIQSEINTGTTFTIVIPLKNDKLWTFSRH